MDDDDDGDDARLLLLFHLPFSPCCKAGVWVVVTVCSVFPPHLQGLAPLPPPPLPGYCYRCADRLCRWTASSCFQVLSWKCFLRPMRFTKKLCSPVFVYLFACLLNCVLWSEGLNLNSSEPRASESQYGGQEVFCIFGNIHFLKGIDQTRSFG